MKNVANTPIVYTRNAIKQYAADAEKKLKESIDVEDWSNACVLQSYINGLKMALMTIEAVHKDEFENVKE